VANSTGPNLVSAREFGFGSTEFYSGFLTAVSLVAWARDLEFSLATFYPAPALYLLNFRPLLLCPSRCAPSHLSLLHEFRLCETPRFASISAHRRISFASSFGALLSPLSFSFALFGVQFVPLPPPLGLCWFSHLVRCACLVVFVPAMPLRFVCSDILSPTPDTSASSFHSSFMFFFFPLLPLYSPGTYLPLACPFFFGLFLLVLAISFFFFPRVVCAAPLSLSYYWAMIFFFFLSSFSFLACISWLTFSQVHSFASWSFFWWPLFIWFFCFEIFILLVGLLTFTS